MRFKELYTESKVSVKEQLRTLWCSEPRNDRQKRYADQIKDLIDNELFTSEQYVPLVQCMDPYESCSDIEAEAAYSCVGKDLWMKSIAPESYLPYRHQALAWKALTNTDGPKKSMVVTTGTGSGKTECFMLPLVSDLLNNRDDNGILLQSKHEIQAIFLYPLNALMEDQKDRLQKLLTNTDLKFAVYNGNLPDEDHGINADNELWRDEAKRIQEEKKKYENIIPTRKEMHETPPNIVLTNPTMLEYMLLRLKDQGLFSPKSLRWIVIDETHTFNGAGAAELAMLIRRVLNAFEVDASNIRFATSSATIGNARSKEEADENNKKLKQFIADITGSEEIEVISGDRTKSINKIEDPEVARCKAMLRRNDFIRLTDLFEDTTETIEQKLNRLDNLCSLPESPLRAKVHFFFRVPNNGLRVQLDDSNDGVFTVKSSVPLNNTATPYLELMRCEHCGEYFAVGESVPGTSNEYQALTISADDIFSAEPNGQVRQLVFGLTNQTIDDTKTEGDTLITVQGNKQNETDTNTFVHGWSIIRNSKYCCPHCHARVLGQEKSNKHARVLGQEKSNKRDKLDSDNTRANTNARSFRIQSSRIAQFIAPPILNQVKPRKKNADDAPHKGQQFISFVDSRKSAAESTMLQNLQQERLWVYSRIFNELNKKRQSCPSINQQELSKLQKKYKAFIDAGLQDFAQEVLDQITQMNASTLDCSLSWNDVFNMLVVQPECEWLSYQFVNKDSGSQEVNLDTDKVLDSAKNKYVYSIMIELLAQRHRHSPAPETIGLFATCYPKLNKIIDTPDAVKKFNQEFHVEINTTEWKNLLKIYMDNAVRSNQSIYFKTDNSYLDIFACQRYGIKKSPRRSVKHPFISDDPKLKGNFTNVEGLLGSLIPNPNNVPLSDIIFENRKTLNNVLSALWEDLTVTTHLVQVSQRFNAEQGRWVDDKYQDENGNEHDAYRLNVVDISFEIPYNMCLVDSRLPGRADKVLRPVSTLFMGMSPYLIKSKAVLPIVEKKKWEPFPYFDGLKDHKKLTLSEIKDWARMNRTLLWENELWGENGCFSSLLNTIYSYPDIFIQAEHTAQVNKSVSRHSQELFTKQEINILACSTTMEMGVDLGNLEVVLMSSIPPHPSNYKQRAGRAGRNNDTRSACLTLCGSDAVGLRILYNPLENLINRKMQVPYVDLQSPQVIQRHANAFLFRESGIYFDTKQVNNLSQEVISFFTSYIFNKDEKLKTFSILTDDANGTPVYPDSGLGNPSGTKYYSFLSFLDGNDNTHSLVHSKSALTTILKGTCFDGGADGCIDCCKETIIKIYDSLESKVKDISDSYIEEISRLSQGTPADRNKVHGSMVNSGYGYFLRHKFSECLAQNLLTFFATNRFTPNANMPVDIVEYNVSPKANSTSSFAYKKSNNPSYPLHEALSQYVPGNTVVLENKTSIVRGISYTGQYKQTSTFKSIYSDGENSVIDFKERLKGQPKIWSVSGNTRLTLVEPVSFIPDINEDYSRVLTRNNYTQVSAQLIGAGEWQNNDTRSMVAMRSNENCCEAKILYYNEGIGYGYCFCPKCGKTVIEKGPMVSQFDLPEDMNDQEENNNSFHYHIDRKDCRNNHLYRIRCKSTPSSLQRNVILGGLIQTDYCEIKIKEKHGSWVQRNAIDDRLLITLGILFTKAYTEYINKDRSDVSFALMPNGHICIFDTNPGGSGYSNKLAGQRTMTSVIERAIDILKTLPSKDALLDRYTLNYLDKLDVDAAREWLDMAKQSLETVPDNILKAYPNAKVAVLEDINTEYRQLAKTTNIEKVIFVNSDWDKWIYKPEYKNDSDFVNGFKQRMQDVRSSENVKVVVVDGESIPIPIRRMLSQMSEWASVYTSKNTMTQGLFPLAIIGDTIYFTDQKECSCANYNWANSDVFSMPLSDASEFAFDKFDPNQVPANVVKFTLSAQDRIHVNSKSLGAVIESKEQGLVTEFVKHCKKHPSSVITVIYQDEHLKSPVAMAATMQFIEYFMRKAGNPFTVRFLVEEYYNERSKAQDIARNFETHNQRNQMLVDIYSYWQSTINGDGMDCRSVEYKCEKSNTLPHWRSMTFECQGKSLIYYPNGGIINEWFVDYSYTRCCPMEELAEESIPLKRFKEIMYDVELKDC